MNKNLQIPLWIWKTMKITFHHFVLLAVCSGMAYAHEINGQNVLEKSISINVEGLRFKRVLSLIEDQADVQFVYSSSAIDTWQKVNLKASNKKLDLVLKELLQPVSMDFSVMENRILLKSVAPAPNEKSTVLPADSYQMEKVADRTIRGKVTDETGEGLPGVSIVVEGTSHGTVSDVQGQYQISVVDEKTTLTFSFLGYTSQKIVVGDKTLIDITLQTDEKALEEVVVVGYGTQKKATLTGSVTSVSGKDLKHSPVLNISNALAGQLPGVIASNRSGEPGRDNSSILIRGRSTTGNTSPLVVVDGIQGYSGWELINPNDIESISVLKDASAAIYGARAANGVILITTKRGTVGKPTLSYSFNQGLTQPTRVPEMANSALYAEFLNDRLKMNGSSPRFTDEEIQKYRDGSDPLNYPNTDWYGQVLRKLSRQSQHNININGGSESIRYAVSGSYSNQEGIFKNGSTNFKTYSIRSNIDAQVNKYIKIGLDVNGALEDGNYPAFSTASLFTNLGMALPVQPVYWPNGKPSSGIEHGNNPAVMATDATGNNNLQKERFNARATFDVSIPWVKGLGVDGFFTYVNNSELGKNFQKPWETFAYNKATDAYTLVRGGGILAPQLTQSALKSKSTLLNLRAKYENQFGGHHINTFIAVEQSEGRSNNFTAFRRDFMSSALDELFAGSLTGMTANGTASESGRQNLFGRIGYGFKEKYLLDFNFRYDGSSNFPKNRRWGFFPGASVAWRLSQEDFIRDNISFIDDLKVRASYGQIGNDQVAAFQWLSTYSLGNTGYSFGLTPVTSQGLTAGVTPNPNITWEIAEIFNAGLDGTFAKGLFGFTVDYFKQRRSNILAKRDLAIPSNTGLTLPNENIGIVQNQGVELELRHHKNLGQFTYRVGGNVAYARNKIIDISEPQNVPEWQKQEGHIIGSDRFYRALGIIRTKEELESIPVMVGTQIGDLKYEDIDKDGKITDADMVRLDRTNTPEITFGLNLSTTYKNFSLWANFAGQARAWQYFHKHSKEGGQNSLKELLANRYTTGSMDSKYPIIPSSESETQDVSGFRSDFWLMDATFVRLKTLQIGYSLPQALLSKIKVKSMMVYLNGNNLITLDKIGWYDPEGSSTTGSFYPQSKIYNLGVNLSF